MAKKVSTRRAWTTDHVRTLKTLARKKTTGGKDRQDIEANRGRNAAKGVQSGIVTRLPCLKLRTKWLQKHGYVRRDHDHFCVVA